MNLTKNFTLEELTRSETAKARGINNTPSPQVIANLQTLCSSVLQPLRDAWGKPLTVTSGYRCTALNRAVGSKDTSQHRLGQAADIKCATKSKADNKALFDLACKMVKDGKMVVGQLIDEYGYSWLHISTQGGHRNQILHIK